jgi:hypothetical protein
MVVRSGRLGLILTICMSLALGWCIFSHGYGDGPGNKELIPVLEVKESRVESRATSHICDDIAFHGI